MFSDFFINSIIIVVRQADTCRLVAYLEVVGVECMGRSRKSWECVKWDMAVIVAKILFRFVNAIWQMPQLAVV